MSEDVKTRHSAKATVVTSVQPTSSHRLCIAVSGHTVSSLSLWKRLQFDSSVSSWPFDMPSESAVQEHPGSRCSAGYERPRRSASFAGCTSASHAGNHEDWDAERSSAVSRGRGQCQPRPRSLEIEVGFLR